MSTPTNIITNLPTNNNTEELLKRLDEQHAAYLQTFKLVHEALGQSVSAPPSSSFYPGPPTNAIPTPTADSQTPVPRIPLPRTETHTSLARRRHRKSSSLAQNDASQLHLLTDLSRDARTHQSSIITGESDISEDNDDLYVQELYPSFAYSDDDLRDHLRDCEFTESERIVMGPLIGGREKLWMRDGEGEGSVLDVGLDGAPLEKKMVSVMKVDSEAEEGGEGNKTNRTTSRVRTSVEGTRSLRDGDVDRAIWMAIREINADPTALHKAVGRITILREPSPIIFAAIHLARHKDLDLSELFDHLISEEKSEALVMGRVFSSDHRHRRSFVFNFEYYTIVSENCAPMPWQAADRLTNKSKARIPISRCSATVSLTLSGPPIKKIRNAARKAKVPHGYIYDTWAPWQVLSIQCYPDHNHSMESHDSTKHYVNGVDAFLNTLLGEFRDAGRRFAEINVRIGHLITPPPEVMFSRELRDALLFEDEEFTYSRRYFWAYQTLGIMNDRLRAIVSSYHSIFTADVWSGTHKTVWPLFDPDSPRNVYWRKRLLTLKREFEKAIVELEEVLKDNEEKRKEIRTLREQLFSGTSVLESRKSIDMAAVTVLQGHNVKLLTLVNIFFLPLTFVTSVFGMENFPEHNHFLYFGIVMATVCVPFFLLIGSLNTTSGMRFWRSRWYASLAWLGEKLSFEDKVPAGGGDKLNNGEVDDSQEKGAKGKVRTVKTERAAIVRARSSLQWNGVPDKGRRQSDSGTGNGSGFRAKFYSETILGKHRRPSVREWTNHNGGLDSPGEALTTMGSRDRTMGEEVESSSANSASVEGDGINHAEKSSGRKRNWLRGRWSFWGVRKGDGTGGKGLEEAAAERHV